MNILEAIKVRRSVRTYDGQPLSAAQASQINDAISLASSPFGGSVTIKLATVDTGGEFRPSTYGVIKGARSYLLMGLDNDVNSKLSGGFMMEQVVLRACQLGLATCWIAGTFKSKSFTDAAALPAGETLEVVSPIGQPGDRPRFMDRLMRAVASSDKRKPLGDLFFVNDFSVSLTEDGPYAMPLDMMRLAPSSTNSQPWRALVRGNQVDFYCAKDNNYSMIDMGIGLCHFALAADAQNISGAFAKNELPVPAPGNWQYVVSFIEAG